MAKELGMNRFVTLDTSAALMRLSWEVAKEVALMPKVLMTVQMLCSSRNAVRASTLLKSTLNAGARASSYGVGSLEAS